MGDMYLFDTSTLTWHNVSAVNGLAPAARFGHGFTSIDGKLYAFAGQGIVGGLFLQFSFSLDKMNVPLG